MAALPSLRATASDLRFALSWTWLSVAGVVGDPRVHVVGVSQPTLFDLPWKGAPCNAHTVGCHLAYPEVSRATMPPVRVRVARCPRARAKQSAMDRERDYYADRRDRDSQSQPHATGRAGADRSAPANQSTRTLEVWKEGRLVEELDLTACRRYAVGRTEGSDVWTEHESCSRSHAEFRVEAGGVFLVDLDSAAGTCVGAAQLPPHEPRRLHDLAKVTFGTSTRSYLLKLDGEIAPPAAAGRLGKGGGAPAGGGKGAAAAIAGEKRKLLWGNKRALAQGGAQGGVSLAQQRAPEAGASGWASAASALGDSDHGRAWRPARSFQKPARARGIRALRGGLLWRRLSWPTSRPSSSCWSWRGTCAEGARGSSESTSRSACVHPACVRTPSEAHPDQSGCAYASTQDACVRPARRAGPERLRPPSMRAYAQRGAPD